MKKLGAAALALTLAGAMTLPALAAEETPILISAQVYPTSITLNGEALDTEKLPAVDGSLLPMRLLAEADHGSAYWDQEGNQGWFTFGSDQITVNFADNSVTLNDQPLEVAGVEVRAGVTFISSDVLTALEGYSVTWADSAVDITTPNNDPLVKLAYSIQDVSESFGMRADETLLAEAYKIPVDQFEEIVAFFPMITSPDTVVVGKLTEGADQQAVADALEAYRQSQEDTFSWYLSQHLPKVQDARTVFENGYFLFLIGENADQGEQLFRDFVAAQD